MDNKVKYNAFISYNHNPRDIKIAKELQQNLERFRIPKGLKNKKGINRIERVFLDVGELGVSADLNDTIKDALDNTDYLVVICSPESKASPWVHKEIEHFLTTHKTRQILTVITDGEPNEVLPEEILKEEITLDDGSVTTIEREPLSCDFRVAGKEANKTELPRLVAGIIECRYDDLVQRQRQQKMRQMAVAMGAFAFVMTVALSYFIWSNRAIKENYNNTLIEQSKSLTMQSEDALDGGDRVGAIKYALEALPKEGEDRPVVPEAVYALSNGMGLYKFASGHLYNGVSEIASGKIRGTDVYAEGDNLVYAINMNKDQIKIFDPKSNVLYAEDFLDKYCKDKQKEGKDLKAFKLIGSNSVAIIWGDSVYSLDYKNERLNWILKENTLFSYIYSNISCSDNKLLLNASKEIGLENSIVPEYEDVAVCINQDDGKVLCEAALPKLKDKRFSIDKMEISPDGESALLLGKHNIDYTDSLYRLYIMNLSDGKLKEIDNPFISVICDAAYMSDGSIVACGVKSGQDDIDSLELDNMDFGSYGSRQVLTSIYKKQVMVSNIADDAETLNWTAEFEDEFSGLPEIANQDGVAPNNPIIITGSKAREYSIKGELMSLTETQSRIMKAWRREMADRDGISLVLFDGSLARHSDGEKHTYVYGKYFPNPVIECNIVGDALYISSHAEGGVGMYRTLKYDASLDGDPKWEPYGNRDIDNKSITDIYQYEDSFLEYYKQDEKIHLNRMDAKSGELIWSEIVWDEPTSGQEFAGIDYNNKRVVLFEGVESDYEKNKGIFKVKTVDLSKGAAREYKVEAAIMPYTAHTVGLDESGNLLLAFEDNGGLEDDPKQILLALNIDEGTSSQTVLEGEEDIDTSTLFLYDDVKKCLILVNEKEIKGFGDDGKLSFSITDIDYKPEAATIAYDGKLYIVGDSNATYTQGELRMYCYDVESGNLSDEGLKLSDDALEEPYIYGYQFRITELSEDDYLIGGVSSGIIVDKKSGIVRALIGGLGGYNSQVKEFYINQGHAPYRSLEEMIKEANEMIS